MAGARERLEGAHAAFAAGHPAVALSAAYYAALYAARAALSEEDRYAKTHSGTWNLFQQCFVSEGRFEPAVFASASGMQQLREAGDYDARKISSEEAQQAVEHAERFVAAVAAMFEG
jgi:uncharacterized protein (UPF0332 family)